jgi:alkylhydroperoxidase family enzyme
MIPMLSVQESQKRAQEIGITRAVAELNVSRVLLHNPTLAHALDNLLQTLMTKNQVPSRLRELIILRTAWRTASEYEFMRHVIRSRQLEIPEQDILGVRDPDKCPSYSAIDRAVIKLADELNDNAVASPETWQILEKNFPPEQLLELVFAQGHWRMFASFFNTSKVPLDADAASGWPEGRKPR